MPDFPITVTVSTRVAGLVRDAALRTGTELTSTNWFSQEVRLLAVRIARNEKEAQIGAAAQTDFDAIEKEVTT